MRVLLATGMNSSKLGSLEKWILLFGIELQARGHDLIVHYKTKPASKRYLRLLEEYRIALDVSPVSNGRVSSVVGYRGLISRLKAQVVLSLFSSKSIYAAASLGIPRAQNIWINALEMPMYRWTHRLSFASLEKIATTYAASESVRVQMIRAGFSNDAVTIWYFGLPIELIEGPSDSSREPNADTIVSVAHYRQIKGTDLLLRAFSEVLQQFPGARLRQVGIDPLHHSHFPALARALAIDHAVEWVGVQDNAIDEIARASVYVQPSRREALGFSVMEAAYAFKPVVAYRVGGIPEAVLHGRTGLLAEPEDTSRLANHIGALLADSEMRIQFGRSGHSLVREKFH